MTMGLIQEGLRRSGEIRNALAPVSLNPPEIKVNKLPARDARLESRIPELLSLVLGEKDKAERTEEPKLKRADGFEPFVNPEPSENTLFVNGYNGNFTQKMDLNRKGVARVLQIAHLDGQVFLTTLSLNRQKSIEANPDGSVSAKRFLLYQEKAGEDEKDSPLSRVVAVPQGWRIEINDQRLMDELTERKLSGEELKKAFINKFNGFFKAGILKAVWREKMSSEKDEYFRNKLFFSVLCPASQIMLSVLLRETPLQAVIIDSVIIFTLYGLINLRRRSHFRAIKFSPARNIDHPLEYFAPLVEIDKVARTFAFLSLKGRKLVREAK